MVCVITMDKKISLILLLSLFICIGNVSASGDIINNNTGHVDCLSEKCSHMGCDNFHPIDLDSKNILIMKTNVNNMQQGDLNTINSNVYKVNISLNSSNNTQTIDNYAIGGAILIMKEYCGFS